MKAYSGHIRARSGLLLGGVTGHTSHPFELYSDALSWAIQAAQANKDSGRDVLLPTVIDAEHPSPITNEEINL